MAELNLEIVTPSKTAFSGEIKSITVPGYKRQVSGIKKSRAHYKYFRYWDDQS